MTWTEAAAQALPSVALQAAPGGGNKNFDASLHCALIFLWSLSAAAQALPGL